MTDLDRRDSAPIRLKARIVRDGSDKNSSSAKRAVIGKEGKPSDLGWVSTPLQKALSSFVSRVRVDFGGIVRGDSDCLSEYLDLVIKLSCYRLKLHCASVFEGWEDFSLGLRENERPELHSCIPERQTGCCVSQKPQLRPSDKSQNLS